MINKLINFQRLLQETKRDKHRVLVWGWGKVRAEAGERGKEKKEKDIYREENKLPVSRMKGISLQTPPVSEGK